jgi:hypothetical protein
MKKKTSAALSLVLISISSCCASASSVAAAANYTTSDADRPATTFIQVLKQRAIKEEEENHHTSCSSSSSSSSSSPSTKSPLPFVKESFRAMDDCIPSRLHFYPDEYDFVKIFKEDNGDLAVVLLGQLSVVRDNNGSIIERKLFPQKVAFEALEHAPLKLFIRLATLFQSDFRAALSYDPKKTYDALIKNRSIKEVRKLALILMESMDWKPSIHQYARLLTSFYRRGKHTDVQKLLSFVKRTHSKSIEYKFDVILKTEKVHLALLLSAMLSPESIQGHLLPFLESDLGCASSVLYLRGGKMSSDMTENYSKDSEDSEDTATEKNFKLVLSKLENSSNPFCIQDFLRLKKSSKAK